MPMLEWNDTLSTHVSEVDAQHKELVAMVNKLYDSMKQGMAMSVLIETIHGMRKYTEEHFGTEERLMEQHGYPGFPSHKTEHTNFIAKVRQVESDCQAGTAAVTMDLLNFLCNGCSSIRTR